MIESRAKRLESVGHRLAAVPHTVVARAIRENPWFTRADIEHAVEALRFQLATNVRPWLWDYDEEIQEFERRLSEHSAGASAVRPTVGIIMAGNIPMVGFHDMLCAAAAGFQTLYKPSSKDTALMDFAASLFREEGFTVERWNEGATCGTAISAQEFPDAPDAIIATGGDNTRRLFEGRFPDTPTLLRGNRGSVAVLTGNETCPQLRALGEDVFSYSGLGCRSVSHLLLPEGYDTAALAAVLSEHGAPGEGFHANFRQRRAVLAMSGSEFTDGDFFVLRRAEDFSENLSEITYSFAEPARWLAQHEGQVQCVVGKNGIDFGQAQHPLLSDYADGVDTIKFLLNFF